MEKGGEIEQQAPLIDTGEMRTEAEVVPYSLDLQSRPTEGLKVKVETTEVQQVNLSSPDKAMGNIGRKRWQNRMTSLLINGSALFCFGKAQLDFWVQPHHNIQDLGVYFALTVPAIYTLMKRRDEHTKWSAILDQSRDQISTRIKQVFLPEQDKAKA